MSEAKAKNINTNRFANALKGAGSQIIKAGKQEAGNDESKIHSASNDNSKVSIEVKEEVKHIDIDLMIPHEANKIYSTGNIEELALNILENGLLHNIVLRPLPDGKYRIISGHRRRLACMLAVEKYGRTELRSPLCVIRHDIADDISEEIALHKASHDDRKLTDVELSNQIKRLDELYELKRQKEGKLGAKRNELIARDMGISVTQVKRLRDISELHPRMQKLIADGVIASSVALELCSNISVENQELLCDSYEHANNHGIKITREDAKKINDEVRKQIDELTLSFTSLQQEFQNISKSAQDAINEKEQLEKEYREKIKVFDADKKLLNDKIKMLESSSDKITLKAKEKEIKILSNKLSQLEQDKDKLIKEYDEKLKTKENQLSEGISIVVKGNLEVSFLIEQCRSYIANLNKKIDEYIKKEGWKLTEENIKALNTLKAEFKIDGI